jgi:hypothetical protein
MSCDQFPTGSRKHQICTGEADLPLGKINAYRAKWGLDLLAESKSSGTTRVVVHQGQAPVKVRRVEHSRRLPCKCSVKTPTQGPGTELIELLKGWKVPPCQQCKDLAARMNVWGVSGCRERIAEIVEDIFPRAKEWLAANKPWAHAMLPEIVEDAGIRLKLRHDVGKAIDAADAKQLRRSAQYVSHGHKASPATFVDAAEPIFRIRTAVRTSFREVRTLEKTIASLQAAGFETPTIYADKNAVDVPSAVQWPEQLGAFRSFVRMSEHMLQDYTGWMLLCEDDVELKDGAADYLRTLNIMLDQVVSLYVSAKQDGLLAGDGLSEIVGDMHGSLAYLIHSSTLQHVLNSRTFREWTSDQRVDRAFCKAVAEIGAKLLCPRPALAQHIGLTSTLVAGRRLDAARTSHNYRPDRHQSGLVTLITPTGDRPDAFAMCERWVRQQRYTGPIQWIVIDDGHGPTEVNDADVVLRPEPMTGHSLCRNLRQALPHIKGQHVLIIEDDDYYGPDYISVMVGRLQHADLVGEFGAKYYYIRERRWRHNVNEKHASLCRTGFNRAVLPTFEKCITGTDHPSVDLRLWQQWSGSALYWTDEAGMSRMCVGIKGVSGRQSYGWKPSKNAQHDDGSKLKQWLRDDAANYSVGGINFTICPGSPRSPGTSKTAHRG